MTVAQEPSAHGLSKRIGFRLFSILGSISEANRKVFYHYLVSVRFFSFREQTPEFTDTILDEEQLPQALTSYSPCFHKEVGAHGIEERGVYRIHQFEKQEMIVVYRPEESAQWFRKLYQNTVDFFRSLDIPVRTLECCSGDLADLKVKPNPRLFATFFSERLSSQHSR